MSELNIAAHGSYIGTTGINYHFREFFRELSKHCNLKVRNFTVGETWNGLTQDPHGKEPYINDIDKKILYRQSLWTNYAEGKRQNYPIYNDYTGSFDFNIVADVVDHYFFHDKYIGPKIAYTVWESTHYPDDYFRLIRDEYDEVWAASQWQKDCLVKQGMDENFVQVVPAGVYSKIFFPEEVSFDKYYKDGRFKFVIFGRWSKRKSTKEMIETFLKTFGEDEPVDLIVSIDNPFPEDDLKTTEDRLKHYCIDDNRIKIVHYAPREDYVKFLKKGHVFLSCARGEGFNLPLCEAMSCGTPSIYSNCSAQLEFASGKGHPVNIAKELVDPKHPDWGNYCEPDFEHLSSVMRDVYTNYAKYKERAMLESTELRRRFDWEQIGKIGIEKAQAFQEKITKKRFGANNNRILYVTPHLSTGGMPQYLLKKIQLMKEDFDVYCIEYSQIATWFMVQRNQITTLLGDKFFTLQDQPKERLLELIAKIKPGVIHFEEFPETFVRPDIAKEIYKRHRDYLIFESHHGLYFDRKDKKFFPDKFLFVSEYQADIYKQENIPFDVVEYPIELQKPNKEKYQAELGFQKDYKHVINVGLFTSGKNQGELIDYAKALLKEKIHFHFVGSQAPNFENYWGPIMKNLPNNCTVWGERVDVDKFYQASDAMVFTSKMETAPIVIKEALAWDLPCLIYDLPEYRGMYNKYKKVKYLKKNSLNANIKLIKDVLCLT